MRLWGAYATQSTQNSILRTSCLAASARTALMTFSTSTTDPRILEHAVSATRRVLELMSGRSASKDSPTEYVLGISDDNSVWAQVFSVRPRRAANFFHGLALARS